MRVLYLPAYFFPVLAASSSLNEKRKQAFADAGFDTIVYVPTPCRGVTKEIRKKYRSKQLPLQPYDRVAKVYGLGHVCIVACKPGLGGAAMPSKTWSIMSSGRAVLANFDEGELKEILEKNHCGAFTKAGDLDGFVSTIENLSQHPEQCAEMGANGRQFIMKNLTREVGTQKYISVIKSIIKQ